MKKLPSFFRLYHMLNNLRDQYFIFLLTILFVENTVLFPLQTNTAKEIARMMTVVTIIYIITGPSTIGKQTSRAFITDTRSLITQLLLCRIRHIHHILGLERSISIFCIFCFINIKRKQTIFR